MKIVRVVLSLLLIANCFVQIRAQNNGLIQRNDLIDHYRIIQLTDTTKASKYQLENTSFTIRPFNIKTEQHQSKYWVELNNFSYATHYNDSIGMGYNNESFYQATGWQSRYSLGIKARIGDFSIDLQPEYVTAQNKTQAQSDPNFIDAGNFYSRYYFMNINPIDLPSRFGTESLKKFFPGQSSIKYYLKGFSLGISTENLWWGPGTSNSLVLTNNAPGFLHATINTNKPIQTSVGSFEGQIIYGVLDSSGIEPVENVRQQALFWGGAYVPKVSSSKRNLAGMVLTWNPKWVKGLYIGFANMHYYYSDDVSRDPNFIYPYSATPQNHKMASLGSIFVRYAMPEEHAEAYLEVGRADKAVSPFNILGDTIPLGYTAGFRKLFSINKTNAFIELSAEITRLQLPDPRLIYGPEPFSIPQNKGWYTNASIRQGYTHYGQLLGAGIGPGSNSQRLNISWVKGANKIGFHGERVIHNNDFYYYAFITGNVGTGYTTRYYTDLTYGFHVQFAYKQFLVAGLLDFSNALNYQWVKIDGDIYGPSSSDKKNTRACISLLYQINKCWSFNSKGLKKRKH